MIRGVITNFIEGKKKIKFLKVQARAYKNVRQKWKESFTKFINLEIIFKYHLLQQMMTFKKKQNVTKKINELYDSKYTKKIQMEGKTRN